MLSDILVVDFSQHLPGPYATLRLADRGAQVVKVETPLGDPARKPTMIDQKDNYLFRANGRNKKSIVLNLKEESQRYVALDLISQADVVIESFRPGVTKRLGISYEDAVKVNPGIVYCSLSGYGQDGPMQQLGSHDLNYMALSGALAQLTDDNGSPIPPSLTFADMAGGMAASEAILAALVQRGNTGKGAYLDIAIADVMLTMMTTHVLLESATGEQHGLSKLSRGLVSYGIYQTKDQRFVALAALESKFWENFCEAVEKPQWRTAGMTPPHDDNPVYQDMKALFQSRTLAEWTAFSLQVDCCLTPILEAGELYQHPQMQARGLIQECWGHRYVGTSYLESRFVLDSASPAPKLGEHTEEWLTRLMKNS
ncbi:CaiB/BaiF CoA-transferase family protein [Brevibacillus choshinensis]|uniref:CaiB/BaiF CoA transferase family protein n=1 Tax=Brevibacillus choshinensis TaxID=54911 RepID=UPI002E222BB7|nr:CaiB/BaiF CoA-transferase family protein [Brevibacillus choshinensis]